MSEQQPEIENAEFWAGTEEGRILMQECTNCGYLRWPPGPLCTECQSPDHVWSPVSPYGVLETYATYHRALSPAFKDDVPYTVGMIELDDGPRMLGRVANEIDELLVGSAVQAVFQPLKDGRMFPAWTIESRSE